MLRLCGQGCQIFLGTKYQNGEKYTKLPRTIPNVLKILQKTAKSVHKIYHHLPLQDPPKFTQIWIFGLKTNHLATLFCTINFFQATFSTLRTYAVLKLGEFTFLVKGQD
jgi:hypothetical protein